MASNPVLEARRALGLTSNVALATLLDCDRATLDAYAAGRRETPRYIALALAALVAGLPPIGEEDAPRKSRAEAR